METAVYQNLVAVLPNIREVEAFKLARDEIDAMWADQTRSRVNRSCDRFRADLAKLGVVGKTIRLSLVTDAWGNYYYDVKAEAGGRRHDSAEMLPKGSLKVTALKD